VSREGTSITHNTVVLTQYEEVKGVGVGVSRIFGIESDVFGITTKIHGFTATVAVPTDFSALQLQYQH